MRANFSQVSSAATGQVRSLEPRPISTSRQPVLPRKVRSTPSVEEFRPAGAFERILRAHDEADDFRAAQAAGEAEQQDRAVAQLAEIGRRQDVQHRDEMLRQERLLLDGRPAVAAADAGEHGRDMAVLAVEGQGPLDEAPDERREPPLDRCDAARLVTGALSAGGERGEIEPDAFGIGERPQVQTLAGAPAQIVAPVGGVGAVGVLGRRRAGVGPGGLDERLKLCGEGGLARVQRSGRAGGRSGVIGAAPAERRAGAG